MPHLASVLLLRKASHICRLFVVDGFGKEDNDQTEAESSKSCLQPEDNPPALKSDNDSWGTDEK